MRKAIIVWGGWDGHQPDRVAARFANMLRELGVETEIFDTLDVFDDIEKLQTLHLIVPVWTGGDMSGKMSENIANTVGMLGVGIAGNHGGMCDAFRVNTQWQFITGGNWVSHPGGIIKYKVNLAKNAASPIVYGLDDFEVESEQYYLHVDPAVNVLATTRFPVSNYYHVSNGHVDMPVVWTKTWGHGRIFYNSLGHTDNVFDDSPAAQELMRRGFVWAIESRDIAIREGLDPMAFDSNLKMF